MGGESMLCITTGGSMDKTYSTSASAFVVGSPTIKSLVRTVKCAHRVRYEEVCRKDSLELTEADRAEVLRLVIEAEERLVLVTHGTDTLAETAAYVRKAAIESGKTVALTGAMRPEAFKESDAAFNVGGALTVLPYLPPGAHCVFHGVVFSDPSTVVKNGRKDVLQEKSEPSAKKRQPRRGGETPDDATSPTRGGRGRGRPRGRGRGRGDKGRPRRSSEEEPAIGTANPDDDATVPPEPPKVDP